MDTIGFLELPSATPEAQALFDEDVAEDGYVMNVTRLWSHNAPLVTSLFDLMGQAARRSTPELPPPRHSRRRMCFDPGRFLLLPCVGFEAGGGLRPRPCCSSSSRERRGSQRRRAWVGNVGTQGRR